MCGEPVAVGPARIVMCDHDLERMDIAAGDVPYVCIRACERAHHVPTGVCAREAAKALAGKQEGVSVAEHAPSWEWCPCRVSKES
jgi:hypothetical protein